MSLVVQNICAHNSIMTGVIIFAKLTCAYPKPFCLSVGDAFLPTQTKHVLFVSNTNTSYRQNKQQSNISDDGFEYTDKIRTLLERKLNFFANTLRVLRNIRSSCVALAVVDSICSRLIIYLLLVRIIVYTCFGE